MPSNGYESVIGFTQGDGSALTNTTTATSLLPSSAKIKLFPGYFEIPGKAVRLRAHGRISTVVTTPGTLTFQVRFIDSAATSVNVFDCGAMTLNVNAQTTAPWILDITMMQRAVGSTATLFSFGTFVSHAVIGSSAVGTAGAGTQMLPYTAAPAPAVGNTFDATLENRVDLFATWSIANAANSITLHNFLLESLN